MLSRHKLRSNISRVSGNLIPVSIPLHNYDDEAPIKRKLKEAVVVTLCLPYNVNETSKDTCFGLKATKLSSNPVSVLYSPFHGFPKL